MALPALPNAGQNWSDWGAAVHDALTNPGASTELRAAFGSVLADNPAVVAAAEDAVSAAGPNLVRVVKGTGTGYPARPVGAALVEYIGPLKPTDWLDDDCWTPTNGVPSGQEII